MFLSLISFRSFCVFHVLIYLLFLSPDLNGQKDAVSWIDRVDSGFLMTKLDTAELPVFSIPANKHSPSGRKIRFHQSRVFAILCAFGPGCRYSLNDLQDQGDVNKVFGYSLGPDHHRHSFRIGWRWAKDSIEVLAYWYLQGENHHQVLFKVKPKERFWIMASIGLQHIGLAYYCKKTGYQTHIIEYNPQNINLPRWGYVNYPFFGGDKKAPHPMQIYLKAWMVRPE